MIFNSSQEHIPEISLTGKIAKIAEICEEATPYINNENRFKPTIGETVTFREPKYARLLKEAQKVLGVSEAEDEFDAINELRLKNRKIRKEITELKKKRLLVPKSSRIPFATTQESLNREIESLENEIMDNREKIELIKDKILEIFYAHNLKLQENELEYFLISAEGDDLLTLMTIANNMKRIQELIEKELATDPNNVELAKSYTGMYLVSLDAYGNAYEAVLANISNYRTKLDNIFLEAESNYNEALRLKAHVNSENTAHINSNLALNKKTLEIIRLYDSLLERRIENLRKSRANVNQKVKIARNTYKTLENGSILINLVAKADEEYSLVINFEMPELKSIYDTGMLNAFMDIAERIRYDK